MYYTSTNKSEVEAYNTLVTQSANLGGEGSQALKWADVITHKDGNQFAIIKNNNYPSEMQEIESLDGWFETQEL